MNWLYNLTLLAQNFKGKRGQLGIPNVKASGGVLDNVIGLVFIVVGALAVLFLVLGGIQYIVSRGDESKIKQAKETIVYSLVGLVIAVSAFLIVEFVTNRIA